MTDQLSNPHDVASEDSIHWRQGTSKNGVAFEVGVCNSEAGQREEAIDEQDSEESAEAKVSNATLPPVICKVHWPVDLGQSWYPATGAEDVGISQYRLGINNGPFYTYRLTFIVTAGSCLRFYFEDEEGDTYTVKVWEWGDHFVRFNSGKPTIVKVTVTGNYGPIENFKAFLRHGKQARA